MTFTILCYYDWYKGQDRNKLVLKRFIDNIIALLPKPKVLKIYNFAWFLAVICSMTLIILWFIIKLVLYVALTTIKLAYKEGQG